jgi:uncharacterized protein (TIGR03435 family)
LLHPDHSRIRRLRAPHDKFKLTFHHEQKDLSFYALTVAKSGSKLNESTVAPDALPELINVVLP